MGLDLLYSPAISTWVAEQGVRILFILVGALIAHYISGAFIERVVRKLIRQGRGSRDSEERRENTLIQVFGGVASVLIWLSAGLMVLSELGVAIGPLLAAAGIAGVAVGFGGQYLIRDIITGLFILMENQYRVGDIVCFDSTCGEVEHISLRMTVLRDLDGVVHHVPHGEVKRVSNLSKDFSRVNLDIGVAYSSDLEQVIEVINRTGRELAGDDAWREDIIEAPQFLRVNEFADSAILVKILGQTKPLRQWAVAGELRKRLKIAFDNAGIEIPFPQRVVHMAPRDHSLGE
jgi:small conductance mechanosensitive channel